MSRCNRCGIRIIDKTDECPLCHQVLVDDGNENYNSYPDARVLTRRFRWFENFVLFVSIVMAISLMTIEYLVSDRIGWSVLVIFGLVYVNVLIRLAIVGKSGYLFKTICMVILAIVFLWGIDYYTGDNGWSLAYAYPSIILLMDVAIIVIMIINWRNWQSYMMVQILMVLLSFIAMILVWCGVIKFPYLTIIAMLASLFLFLGTLIIGDQRARNELKRRFHI